MSGRPLPVIKLCNIRRNMTSRAFDLGPLTIRFVSARSCAAHSLQTMWTRARPIKFNCSSRSSKITGRRPPARFGRAQSCEQGLEEVVWWWGGDSKQSTFPFSFVLPSSFSLTPGEEKKRIEKFQLRVGAEALFCLSRPQTVVCKGQACLSTLFQGV